MRAENSASAPAKTGAPVSDAIRIRERGLSLVSRANRWMIGLALLLAGALTGLTAHAFHAKPASAQAAGTVASSQTQDDGSASAGTSAPSLQAPSSAPAAAVPVPAPVAPVSSGGS